MKKAHSSFDHIREASTEQVIRIEYSTDKEQEQEKEESGGKEDIDELEYIEIRQRDSQSAMQATPPMMEQ